MGDEAIKASGPMAIAVEEKKYMVTICLSDKCWNEELQKYLYIHPDTEKIIVSDSDVITFTMTSIWRIVDRMYKEEFESIRIERA